MKIIHLAIDDKFLGNEFIPNLKRFYGLKNNHFLVICDDEPKFLIKEKDISLKYIKKDEISFNLKEKLPFEKIIIHGYVDSMRESILSLPKYTELTTIVYGFEFYSKIENKIQLYKTATKDYMQKNKKKPEKVTGLKNFLYKKKYDFNRKYLDRRSFKRIDRVAHFNIAEFSIFKKTLNLNASYLEFNIGLPFDLINKDFCSNKINNNILIGNSADPTNNHLDTIESITSLDKNSNIYCPLSYASNVSYLNYEDEVISFGRKKFGNKFKPITKFLSLDDYIKLLGSCDKIILNHLRMQGGLTAKAAIIFEKELYLDLRNPLYSFFENMGIKINSFSKEIDLNKKTTIATKRKNKEILEKFFNEESVKKRYKDLVS